MKRSKSFSQIKKVCFLINEILKMFFKKLFGRDKKEEAAPQQQQQQQQATPQGPPPPELGKCNSDGDEYYFMKIALVGLQTSHTHNVILAYVDGDSKEYESLVSIGVDFKIKRLTMPNGDTVKVQIFPSNSGPERQPMVPSSLLRFSHGMFLCYDPTDPNTFKYINDNASRFSEYFSNPNVPTHILEIVSNKGEKQVPREDVQALADKLGIDILTCDMYNVEAIDGLFNALVIEVGKKHNINFDGGNK